MKTGIRGGAYWGERPFEMMRLSGIDALNYVGFASLKSELYRISEEEVRERLNALRQEVEAAGLIFNQTHAACPTDDSTPGKRAANTELLYRAMRGTAVLGARDIVIHPLMPFGHEAGVQDDPDGVFQLNLDWIREILPYAHELGIRLNIENMPYANLDIARFSRLLELVREVNDDSFGLCLDTGHAACIGDEPSEMVRLAKEKLYTLHVHDNNKQQDLHLIPFAGRIDWGKFREALRETGFEGVVSLEVNVSPFVPEEMFGEMRAMMAGAVRWLAYK